jgi:hypothetical protein
VLVYANSQAIVLNVGLKHLGRFREKFEKVGVACNSPAANESAYDQSLNMSWNPRSFQKDRLYEIIEVHRPNGSSVLDDRMVFEPADLL